jgi:hypothetical protein
MKRRKLTRRLCGGRLQARKLFLPVGARHAVPERASCTSTHDGEGGNVVVQKVCKSLQVCKSLHMALVGHVTRTRRRPHSLLEWAR